MSTYNQPSFQDYRSRISIIELALHVGYEWQPKKGKTLPVLYHPDLDEHIVVKNPKDSSSQVYFTTGSYSDRGTLINFVSNRLTTCFNSFNNPNRSPAQCINDVLKDYLGILPERKQSVKKLEGYIHQSFHEASTEKEFSLEHYKLSKLPSKNYLTQERSILPDLLSTAQFLDTVALQRVYFAEGKPVLLGGTDQPPNGEKIVENIAFPYIPGDGEPVNGLELRTATFKSHATGSDRGHGIWISNPNETPIRRLVVGESAIDLLSYRQLEISTGVYPQTDSRYASIGGSLSLDHLTTLAKFMQPTTQLVFGFDNDDKGARYALSAIIAFSKDGLALVQASQQGYVALQIPVVSIQNQFSKLIAEHSLAMQTYLPQANGEVRDDIIKNMFHWVKGTTIPTLEIPINTALLNSVNNLLIQYGHFSRSVAITRPRGKDFNEDLKAEQLRQIKRPILLINPVHRQIVDRFATENEALQFIEKDVLKAKKWKTIPVGTELQILKTEPSKLYPEPLGKLRRTSKGIEKIFTDSFITKVNLPIPDPTKSPEAML